MPRGSRVYRCVPLCVCLLLFPYNCGIVIRRGLLLQVVCFVLNLFCGFLFVTGLGQLNVKMQNAGSSPRVAQCSLLILSTGKIYLPYKSEAVYLPYLQVQGNLGCPSTEKVVILFFLCLFSSLFQVLRLSEGSLFRGGGSITVGH